jgi:hypothetical protein
MEEYNGCSVPQYTAYPSDMHLTRGCIAGSPEIENYILSCRHVILWNIQNIGI